MSENYKRHIFEHPACCVSIISEKFKGPTETDNLAQWFVEAANEAKLNLAKNVYLLAHADDGVIWGKVVDGRLITSYDALYASQTKVDVDNKRIETAKDTLPSLRLVTLQQARLFCETGELLIWKDGDGIWQDRVIRDVQKGETPDWEEAFDEPQLLWGTHGTQLENDFTLLEEGAQGLRHAVPVKLALQTGESKFGETTPPKLVVRHYLNKEGFTRVVASRLVGLQ